ncbi:GPI12 [Sanghuangporus weigelae]
MANIALGILSILFALVFLVLSSPKYYDNTFFRLWEDREHDNEHPRLNVLLLTAHPDDECMFFAPTLLGLARITRHVGEQGSYYGPLADVYSLCLSSGDAEGLGETRKSELEAALDVLGIREGRRWLLDEPFHDNITESWDAKLIAQQIKPYIEDNKIDVILTFDELGISSHPNHISLERGVRAFLSESPRRYLRAFSLKTTDLIPKYTGAAAGVFAKYEEVICVLLPNSSLLQALPTPLAMPFLSTSSTADCSKFDGEEANGRALFLSSWPEYVTALFAMQEHQSQLIWFRWLYMLFSRYMWVNEWEEIIIETL